jgi:uncharacterized protein YijF (DUF1287 family)
MQLNQLIFCLLLLLPTHIYSQEYTQTELADSAFTLSNDYVIYNPKYFSIPYPNGEIPEPYGVCTDVIIRAYRKVGVDLQKEVHEDMAQHFSMYPKNWGLSSPDKNIDHRRVPNLMIYFSRFGTVLANSSITTEYKPGDIVCWDLGAGIKHIGIVINQKSEENNRHLIIHNIGSGQKIDDILFEFKIIGHYRY